MYEEQSNKLKQWSLLSLLCQQACASLRDSVALVILIAMWLSNLFFRPTFKLFAPSNLHLSLQKWLLQVHNPQRYRKAWGGHLCAGSVQQLCVVRKGLTPSSESRCYLLDRKFNPVFQNWNREPNPHVTTSCYLHSAFSNTLPSCFWLQR